MIDYYAQVFSPADVTRSIKQRNEVLEIMEFDDVGSAKSSRIGMY